MEIVLPIIATIAIILWLRYPITRSEAWCKLKLWAEDNEEAALVREKRRAARKVVEV